MRYACHHCLSLKKFVIKNNANMHAPASDGAFRNMRKLLRSEYFFLTDESLNFGFHSEKKTFKKKSCCLLDQVPNSVIHKGAPGLCCSTRHCQTSHWRWPQLIRPGEQVSPAWQRALPWKRSHSTRRDAVGWQLVREQFWPMQARLRKRSPSNVISLDPCMDANKEPI